MGPAKPTPRRPLVVTCRCGARLTIDSGTLGRPHVCPKCGRSIAARRSPFTAFCGCGYSRPVPPEDAETTPPCPGCGKLMVVEKAPDPKELQKLYQAKKPGTAAPLVPLRLRPPIRVQVKHEAKFFECPCGERILIRKEATGKPLQCPACERHHLVERLKAPPPAPAVPAPGKAGRKSAPPAPAAAPPPPRPSRPLRMGEFTCKCGAIQPPRTSRTGREFTCAACGRTGRLDQVVDPKTQDSVFRVVITSEPGRPRPG